MGGPLLHSFSTLRTVQELWRE